MISSFPFTKLAAYVPLYKSPARKFLHSWTDPLFPDPDIPWIGYSTFFQCPREYKEWIDHYIPKLPQTDGIKKLIKGL